MTTWTKDNVKNLLMTNERALVRALMALWQYQTESEKNIGEAIEDNNVGFNKPDSATAKKFIAKLNLKNKLDDYEIRQLRSLMTKYCRQLAAIANLNELKKVRNYGQSSR